MVGFAEAFTSGLNSGANATRGLVMMKAAGRRARARERELDIDEARGEREERAFVLAAQREERENDLFLLEMERAERERDEWLKNEPLRDAERLTLQSVVEARRAEAETSLLASGYASSFLKLLTGGGGGEDPGQPASDGRTVKAPMPPAAPRASTPSLPVSAGALGALSAMPDFITSGVGPGVVMNPGGRDVVVGPAEGTLPMPLPPGNGDPMATYAERSRAPSQGLRLPQTLLPPSMLDALRSLYAPGSVGSRPNRPRIHQTHPGAGRP